MREEMRNPGHGAESSILSREMFREQDGRRQRANPTVDCRAAGAGGFDSLAGDK